MSDKNKVKFGLRNVHYAAVTVDNLTGAIGYGEVKRWPGAVSLTLDPLGDAVEFKADDVTYYYNPNNQGYSGTLNTALIPDDFRVNHLGEVKDANGVYLESSQDTQEPFALFYEVQGDKHGRRFIYYSCNAARPTTSEETADTGEPTTEELSFSAGPRSSDYLIKARTYPDSKAYATWFSKPYVPNTTPGV